MTSMNDPPDLLGSMAALAKQAQDCQEKLLGFKEALNKKDERIERLENDKERLTHKVQALTQENSKPRSTGIFKLARKMTSPRPSSDSLEHAFPSVTVTQADAERIAAARKHKSGFTLLHREHKDWRDIFDDATVFDYGEDLRRLLATSEASRKGVQNVRRGKWKLTVFPEADTGYQVKQGDEEEYEIMATTETEHVVDNGGQRFGPHVSRGSLDAIDGLRRFPPQARGKALGSSDPRCDSRSPRSAEPQTASST